MSFGKYFLLVCFICEIKSDINVNLWESSKGIFEECVHPGEIALTFDDGPSPRTEAVLDVLKDFGVKATFFVNGDNYENITDPAPQRILRRIVNEGHQIGSHCWTHLHLTDNLSEETIRKQMTDLDDKFQEILGFRTRIMRPPYGELNETVRELLHDQMGYSIIMWSIETNDWENLERIDKSMEAYYEAMEGASSQNSSFIALHHDTVVGGTELATRAIDYVREKGYLPVLIARCIGEINK